MDDLGLIDWRLVAFSALWIFGSSIVLAALSFADYRAGQARTRTREVLRRPGFQATIYTGLVLVCIGLLGTAGTWWEQAIWGALGLGFAAYAWRAWQAHRRGTMHTGG